MRTQILLLTSALLSHALPVEQKQATCTAPPQRKSWHTLTRPEKLSYLSAEKCLMARPATLNLPGTRTRFDELQMIHVRNTADGPIHGVGVFLPFHRYYVALHESLLRTECNYTGGQPYWDESLDAGKFSSSILLDGSDESFGDTGKGKGGCVVQGPFKDYVNPIGPGQEIKDHCIDRQVNDCLSGNANATLVNECLAHGDFVDMWNCIEGVPHPAGHGGVGGQMLNVFSSPGDPLFYLHHGWLDKLWWDWQSANRSARISAIGGTNQGIDLGNFTFPPFDGNGTFPIFPGNGTGSNSTFPPFPPFPPPSVNGSCSPFGFPGGPPGNFSGGFPGFPGFPGMPEQPFKAKAGDPKNVTTLGHVINVYGMAKDVAAGDVMDIQGGLLCYEYV
ncbi:Di-copper centre-containing protein [Polyplosphaeria fusca]|uniref:Di-copper centre-containing protein n=1 Tax=Polyplosphaeria fusca TaxID=682080 RepID=A0A9P4QUE5_9PLEO|nr:Di-copper centre-containing protein [Polyplosphaeria fusca]